MSISTAYLRRHRWALASALAGLLGLGALSMTLQSAAVAEGDDATEAAETVTADLDDANDSDWTQAYELTTFDLVLTRDPFETVRPPTEESTTPASSGGTQGGDENGSGGDSDNEDEGTNGDGPACVTNGEVVCEGRVVSVLSTVAGGSSAVIQVDGTTYEVEVGDTFAGSFRLLAIDADACAQIVYGDEAFTQCPGASTLK